MTKDITPPYEEPEKQARRHDPYQYDRLVEAFESLQSENVRLEQELKKSRAQTGDHLRELAVRSDTLYRHQQCISGLHKYLVHHGNCALNQSGGVVACTCGLEHTLAIRKLKSINPADRSYADTVAIVAGEHSYESACQNPCCLALAKVWDNDEDDTFNEAGFSKHGCHYGTMYTRVGDDESYDSEDCMQCDEDRWAEENWVDDDALDRMSSHPDEPGVNGPTEPRNTACSCDLADMCQPCWNNSYYLPGEVRPHNHSLQCQRCPPRCPCVFDNSNRNTTCPECWNAEKHSLSCMGTGCDGLSYIITHTCICRTYARKPVNKCVKCNPNFHSPDCTTPACHGTGRIELNSTITCSSCDGVGWKPVDIGNGNVDNETCTICHGSGRVEPKFPAEAGHLLRANAAGKSERPDLVLEVHASMEEGYRELAGENQFPAPESLHSRWIRATKELQAEIHEDGVSHGWWQEGQERNIGEMFINFIGEIMEAWEQYRDNRGLNEIWYNDDVDPPGKPEGIPIELADTLIRMIDVAEGLGIGLAEAVIEKMEYNKKRSYRHGNKRA